ncbi:aldehyde dehydrogenase family protein, partial [Acinetobacter baumannii]
GAWVAPAGGAMIDVIDPATEQPFARIALGSAVDADRAGQAARRAFPAYAATTRADRIALLQRIVDGFARRHDELARVVSREMGSPLKAA